MVYPNAPNENGRTPIHYATKDVETVKFLATLKPVKLNAANSDGETPLQISPTNSQYNCTGKKPSNINDK